MPVRAKSVVPAVIAILTAVLIGVGVASVGPVVAGVAAGMVGGFAVLVKPMLGLAAMIFLLPFEDVVLFGSGSSTITKALGLGVALAWLLQKLIRHEHLRPLLHSGLFAGGVLFISFAASSRLWATYTSGFIFGIIRLGMMLVFALLVLDLIRSWDRAEWVAKLLVLGGMVAAGLTLYQYFAIGDVSRAGGMISSGPNSVAFLQVSIVPFSFYLMRASDRVRWRVIGLLFLGLAVVAVAVTYSRMGILMLPLVILAGLYETLRTGRGVVPLLVATAVGGILLLRFVPMSEFEERIDTIGPYIRSTLNSNDRGIVEFSARGYHLKMAVEIFKDHPFVGAGFNNYGREFLRYQFDVPGAPQMFWNPRGTHSSYFGILADLGLVGITLWLGLLGYSFYCLISAWKMLSDRRESREFLLVQAVMVSLAVQVMYGFYDNLELEKLYWVLIGLSVASPWLANQCVSDREPDESHGECSGILVSSGLRGPEGAPARDG